MIKDFVKTIPPQNARYIRIRAAPSERFLTGTRAGGDAWIFVDEILAIRSNGHRKRIPAFCTRFHQCNRSILTRRLSSP